MESVDVLVLVAVVGVACLLVGGAVGSVAFVQARKIIEGDANRLCQVMAQADERVRAQTRRTVMIENKLWATGQAHALLAYQQAETMAIPAPDPVPDHAMKYGVENNGAVSTETLWDLHNQNQAALKNKQLQQALDMNPEEDGMDARQQPW